MHSQSSWAAVTNHPSSSVERVFSFHIDGVLYIGCGRSEEFGVEERVWAYDTVKDEWAQKNDFPGDPRRNAFAFAIDGKGYMGTGYDGLEYLDDFWSYDPDSDTWTQLEDFPGGRRSHSVCLSEGSKAYVVSGGRDDTNDFYNDLWEFDKSTETWAALENFPGEGRWRAYGWLLDDKIYVGGGALFGANGYLDLYAYDLNDKTWESRENCPTRNTVGGFHFTLEDQAYFLEGASIISEFEGDYGTTLFQYDDSTDTWSAEESSFIGDPRVLGFNTTVGNKIYLGLGRSYYPVDLFYNDIYSFSLEVSSVSKIPEGNYSIYPNPTSNYIFLKSDAKSKKENWEIYNVDGKLIFKSAGKSYSETGVKIDVSDLSPGNYYIKSISTKNGLPFVKL